MPIPKKIINFIEKAKVKYEPIEHKIVYTAYDKAQTLKVPQKIVGKTLIVKLEKRPVFILIPANKNLDKEKLKKVARAKKIDFLKEAWMKKNLKGIKIGAIPPFGDLWGFQTFVDKNLLKEPPKQSSLRSDATGQAKIIVSAGDYNWSIKIKGPDLKKLIPDLVVGNFGKTR